MIMEEIKIVKRDGRLVDFNPEKIYQAIRKAASQVYAMDETLDNKLVDITKKVTKDIVETHADRITISMIQSAVENRLLDYDLIHIAEAYIEYRLQRDVSRYRDNILVNLEFKKL